MVSIILYDVNVIPLKNPIVQIPITTVTCFVVNDDADDADESAVVSGIAIVVIPSNKANDEFKPSILKVRKKNCIQYIPPGSVANAVGYTSNYFICIN